PRARPLRPLGAVAHLPPDFVAEHGADTHHSIDHLRPARKVIFLFHGVWLDPRLKVFRQIPPPAGHPASRFNAAGRDVMVGVLLVMSPRVVADDRVHFHQPEDEDQPVAQLGRSDGVEFVIAVMQVEDFFKPRRRATSKLSRSLLRTTSPTVAPRPAISSLLVRIRIPVYPSRISLRMVPPANRGKSSQCGWMAASTLPRWGRPSKSRSMKTSAC